MDSRAPQRRESRGLILEEGKGYEDGSPSLEKTKLFCLSADRKFGSDALFLVRLMWFSKSEDQNCVLWMRLC